jgi:hypothetical protein
MVWYKRASVRIRKHGLVPIWRLLAGANVATQRIAVTVRACLGRIWRRSWREVNPRRLFRMYISLLLSTAALLLGLHFVPPSDALPVITPALQEVDVAVDHPNVGMYVGFFASRDQKVENEVQGPADAFNSPYELVVALNIKSRETVHWVVDFDAPTTVTRQLATPHRSFAIRKYHGYRSSPGVKVSSDSYDGVAVSGSIQGPVDGTSVLSGGVVGSAKHLSNLNPSFAKSTDVAFLSGNVPGQMTTRGAAISVTMPSILPFLTNPFYGNPGEFRSPAHFISEEGAIVGRYSVQSGNATMAGSGLWDWFDGSGGIIVAQSTGTDSSIQSNESRSVLYAGIAFGIAGSSLVAAILEYRRPSREVRPSSPGPDDDI